VNSVLEMNKKGLYLYAHERGGKMLLKIQRHRKVYTLADGRQLNAIKLDIEGKVEATTIAILEKEFEPLCEKQNLHVVVDMANMAYTTSTGMGALVQYASLLEAKGGRLSLFSPAEAVKQVIQLLGLDAVLPMFQDEADLCANYLSNANRPNGSVAKQEQIDLAVHRAKASRGASNKVRSVQTGTVVFAMPEQHFFYQLLQDALLAMGCTVHFATTSTEVWKLVQAYRPSVLLVDYALEGHEELCLSIKTQPETSACSIVKVYPQDYDLKKSPRLSVIPNEFICEPCSIQQLQNFIDSEIKRHQDESCFFHHELYFCFPSEVIAIDKANALIERLLIKSIKGSNERLNSFISAVREAIDNAKRHGHSKLKSANIRILYLLDDEKITVSVKDEGPGFDWKPYAQSASQNAVSLAQARPMGSPGGLGIALMTRACDRLSFNNSGNEVTLAILIKSCLP
jgi:anti-anti-sigma factor